MPNGKGYTITYDGVASTTIPEFMCHGVRRTLIGKNRDSFEDVAGLEGAWHFPEKRGLKQVTIRASILASDFPVSRRNAIERVADWLDKTAMKKLIIGDQPDRYEMAVLADTPELDEWRHKGSFDIPMLALPFSYKIAVDSQVNNGVNAGASWTYSVDTLCKVDTYPIIQLRPRGGNISSLGFTLTTNGRTFTYAASVAVDTYLTISSVGYTVHTGVNADTDLQGLIDPATLSMIPVSGYFPIFKTASPGTNSVVIALGSGSTATSVDFVTSWRRRYRS